MSNERPILFSGPMVRAILDGRKTMTRRVHKVQPNDPPSTFSYKWDGEHWRGFIDAGKYAGWCDTPWMDCPYGEIGDRLWVRETFGMCAAHPDCDGVYFKADTSDNEGAKVDKWRPSIFMPRWASRITLEIAGVKVERVQDINEEDAKAEGIAPWINAAGEASRMAWRDYSMSEAVGHCCPRESFRTLWDSINAKRAPWASNPWVWIIDFKRVPA